VRAVGGRDSGGGSEVLPEQARQLPAELARIDAFLDDERFIAPWRTVFADPGSSSSDLKKATTSPIAIPWHQSHETAHLTVRPLTYATITRSPGNWALNSSDAIWRSELRGPNRGPNAATAPRPSRTVMDSTGVERAGQYLQIKVTSGLIAFGTKRSWVQIPPPRQLKHQVRGLLSCERRPLVCFVEPSWEKSGRRSCLRDVVSPSLGPRIATRSQRGPAVLS
jgi:hypothetical protein